MSSNNDIIDGKIRPVIRDGQVVWDVTADQVEELRKIRGLRMLEAIQQARRDLNRDLSKMEIRKIARNAGGMVFIDGVEGVTGDVGQSMAALLGGKDKYPTIKPKVKRKDTARGARTEVADEAVLEWARKLDEQQAWPKGKSEDGYEKWLRTNYETLGAKNAADFARKYGYQVDIGHAAQGPNAKSMLSPQLRWGYDGNRTTAQWYTIQEGDTLESIAKSQSTAPKLIERMQESTKGWTKKDMEALKAGELEAGRRIKLFKITDNTDHVRLAADIEAADIASTHARAFEEYLFEGKNEYKSTKKVNGKEVEVMRSVNTMEGWTPEEMNAVHHKLDYADSAEAAQIKIRNEHFQRQHRLAVAKANPITGVKASGVRNTDALLRLGMAYATGDVVGGTLAGGQIAMTKALQNPKAQARIAKQIAALARRRGMATAAKLIPGLDVAMSTMEAFGYLSEGKLDQAGIAALSGAIGWIPIVGDAAAAGLDLTNTGLDIARLDWDQVGKKDPEVMEIKQKQYDPQEYWEEFALDKRYSNIPDTPRIKNFTGAVEVLQDLSKL